ncbi:heat-shock protein Hsp20 [Acidiferrobacter sp. SPIII_3]|uniref:Hsp20/alpha crystallin family protein n=1 Tax=Acidiferrobacter sp. SPIII_3 TaxID=1281578 RepID=UPI000D73F732|nr:Hsp20/alpha crystallin family protein [Acidiferrobacter sp. SPIII_3]AWP22336.1 heat-shock protein Hsp20 [Acidiferrobacter sp. SPIII_3]
MAALMPSPTNSGWTLVNDELDNLLEGFFRPLRRRAENGVATGAVPAMDVTERENEYVIRMDMPGVNREDIDITLAEGVLTVSGEVKRQHEDKAGDRLIREERCYGKLSRSVRLGSHIDDKKVSANYKDGVLELTLPKAEEMKPKKITVA